MNRPSGSARSTAGIAASDYRRARQLLRALERAAPLGPSEYWLGNEGPFSTAEFDARLRALEPRAPGATE